MHTPHLDRLVENGVSFSNCFVNSPVCMPSRCSFMTGCYPSQTGVWKNGQELPADFQPVVASSFASGGFQPVQIGKLHFQCHQDSDLDPSPRSRYGFDTFSLSEEPGCYEDAYRIWLRGEFPEYVDTFTVPRPLSFERHGEARNFKVLDAPWQASHSGWIATQFTRYLSSWGIPRNPHFFHLGFYAPHPPLNPTEEMFAPYRDREIPPHHRSPNDSRDPKQLDDLTLQEYRRHFYAMVTGVDLAVGQISQVLKDTGLFDDTLIVFGSDHGDACGDNGRVSKDDSYYDSIMRVPLVLHWPAGLGTGSRKIDGLFEMVDVLPSLLELSSCPIDYRMQGTSFAQDLLSHAIPPGRDSLYAIHGSGNIMLRTSTHKYLRYQDHGQRVSEILIDLENDPHEFHDCAPEPAYRPALEELRNLTMTRHLAASRPIQRPRARF